MLAGLFGREKETADPSASLGMKKGRVALPWRGVAKIVIPTEA
jgi:hypothetical protein